MATITGTGGPNTSNDTVGTSDQYDMLGGSDTVYAGAGNDTLYGGADSDLLYGGSDNDTVYGDAGTDTLYGDTGNDRLYGGADSDTLYGGDNDDTLDGGTGSDRLYAGNGNDLIYAGAFGNPDADFIDGGAGQDTVSFIEGSGGIDLTLVAGNATIDPAGGGNTDTLTGIEHIIGTNFNDTITGDTVSNMLDGGANSDVLTGGAGNDTLYGGAGADSLFGGADNDLLYGDADNDSLRGGAGNDTVFGGTGVDLLRGDGGTDILIGGAGADTIDGDAGTDTASYVGSSAGVNVTINASGNTGGDAAGDTLLEIENLTGSSNADTLVGDGGNNVIDGGDGADTINGAAGNDTVFGGLGDDTIDGGTGNDSLAGDDNADLITGGAGNDTIDGGTGTDTIFGGGGNDSIAGGSEADTIEGGIGNDTIDGGSGDDLITAGPATGPAGPVSLDFNWNAIGANGTDITNVTQDTGGVNVNVVLTDAGDNFNLFDVESVDTIYVAGGEPFNPNSGAELRRDGDGAATVIDINFSAVAGSGFGDEVENVQFRISDIDDQGWRDRVIIRAWDAAGNPITVSLSEASGGDLTTSGSTVQAVDGAGNTTLSLVDGSVLVNIAGPVARIEITYDNLETDAQVIYVSDIHFDGVPVDDDDSVTGGDGNDTILGGIGEDTLLAGLGNDVLYGGIGNDSLNGNEGNDTLLGDGGTDTLRGAAGNDTFLIANNDEVSTAGNDIIYGGGGAEEGGTGAGQGIATDFDVIDLELIGEDRVTINYTSTDPLNLVGTIIIYTDATKTVEVGRIDFSEIERIIFCFTQGTMIRTDRGEVAVETLRAGDMVMTRDNGLQPLRWTGSRTLSCTELKAKPDLQPVRIAMGAFAGEGPERTMLVSPQHRVLIEGARAEILFGEAEVLVPAKHLIGHVEATRALPAEGVIYIHLLFDQHEIVQSDGIWTESFQPAERSLNAMDDDVRNEILTLFPELQVDAGGYQSARLSLKAHEVRVLLSN